MADQVRPVQQPWRSESRDAARYAFLAQWTALQPDPATQSQPASPAASAKAEKIDAILANEDASWDEINLVEQLLIDYLPAADLDEAIERRLIEAQRRLVPDAAANAARYAKLAAGTISDPAKRSFLKGIVGDIQHFSLRSKQVRRLRANAIGFVSGLSSFAFVLVLVPFIAFLIHQNLAGSKLDTWVVNTISNFPNYGLYTAVSFGFLGALFSRFLQLQTNYLYVPIDDAEIYYRYENITLRLFIGTVAAVIVYFIAASGVLQGDIVPDIRRLAFETVDGKLRVDQAGQSPGQAFTVIGMSTEKVLVPARDLALLVIWAFLAGFSEQLVPDLLSSTTTRVSNSAAKAAKSDK